MIERRTIETPAAGKPPWEASLELRYAAARGRTYVTSRHRGPLLVQRPFYDDAPVCESVVIHPPGGIACGDRLAIDVALEPGTHALVTTPGASRWHRSSGAEAVQQVRIRADDAIVEWLPAETIVYDGAHARMELDVDLTGSARFLGFEVLCLGRTASGERFERGSIRRQTNVRCDGRLVRSERTCLGGGDPFITSALGFQGRTVAATLLLAGVMPEPAVLDACRAVRPVEAGARVGITALPRVVAASYLGDSSEKASQYLRALWQILRPAHLGRAAKTPRLWNT